MSEHTPGPWKLMEFGGDSPAIGIHPQSWPHKVLYWIASVPLGKAPGAGCSIQACGATVDEARANAKLIASAPELLFALQELAQQADEDCPQDSRTEHFHEALREAEAALQKATT